MDKYFVLFLAKQFVIVQKLTLIPWKLQNFCQKTVVNNTLADNYFCYTMTGMKKFITVVFILVAFIGAAYGGWYLYKKNSKPNRLIIGNPEQEKVKVDQAWGSFSLPAGWHITNDKQCSHSVTSSISQTEMIATYDVSPTNSALFVSICIADRHNAKSAADWYETYEDNHPQPDSTHTVTTERQGDKEVYIFKDDRSKEDTMQYTDLHYVVLVKNKAAYITARTFEVLTNQSGNSATTSMTTNDYRSYEPQVRQIVDSIILAGK